MTTNWERVFGIRTLNGRAFESFTEMEFIGAASRLFEQQGTDLAPEGNTLEWDEAQMPKTAAGFTTRSAPAIPVDGLTEINRSSAMADIKLKKHLPAAKLFGQRAAGQLVANAAAVVAREQRGMLKSINISREYLAFKSLLGSVVVSPATIPDTQVSFTLTFNIATRDAAADWNLPATNIVSSEIPLTISAYFQAARMMPRRAIIDTEVRNSIRANNEVQTFVTNDPSPTNRLISTSTVLGPSFDEFELLGLRWETNEVGYDVNSVFTKYHLDGRAIILPDDPSLVDVLGMGEGFGDIPINAIGNGTNNIAQAPNRGAYSYATAAEDPVGLNLYSGWRGLFVLLFPSGVLLLDSTP